MPGSVSGDSVRSYKRVGQHFEVDSLSLDQRGGGRASTGMRASAAGSEMLDRSSLRRIGATIAAGNAPPNGLVISRSELNKYRSMSTIKTAEQSCLSARRHSSSVSRK